MHDESDSEGEEAARLREAVWDVASLGKVTNTGHKKQLTKPSLRTDREDCSSFNADYKSLDATPEFQSFVAKKLGAMLDETIEEAQLSRGDSKKAVIEEGEDSGFRLFSTSKTGPTLLQQTGTTTESFHGKRKAPPAVSDSDSEDEFVRLREATVSGEEILQGGQQAIPPESEQNVTMDKIPDKPEIKKKKKKRENEMAENLSTEESHSVANVTVVDKITEKKKNKKKQDHKKTKNLSTKEACTAANVTVSKFPEKSKKKTKNKKAENLSKESIIQKKLKQRKKKKSVESLPQ